MKSDLSNLPDLPGSEIHLKRLYRSTLKFLVPLNPEETYPVVGRAAIKLFDAQYASIFIRKGRKLVRVWDSSEKMFRVKSDKKGYAAHAVRSRSPSVINLSKLAPLHPNILDWGVKSIIFIPLFYRSTKMGYIALDCLNEIQLTAKKKESLKIFGTMAMLAIRKAQLHGELSEALKTRDLFISLASHELRSPLTTINSYAQLIEKTLSHKKVPEHKWAKILKAETTRMILMVNELLQLNTIKSGKLQYNWKQCYLDDILKRAVINFKARHVSRRLLYKKDLKGESGSVMADFDKLLQAVVNILNNAAKFSSEDIAMDLSYKHPYYQICIKDKGQGIDRKELPKIFNEFYKGKESTKGLGLGLYLTKSIIDLHRGKIKIQSLSGNGTKVQIDLPKYSP